VPQGLMKQEESYVEKWLLLVFLIQCYNDINVPRENGLNLLQVRKLLRLGVPTLKKLCWKQKAPLVQFDEIAINNLPGTGIMLDAGCGSRTRVLAQGRSKLVVGVDRGKPETPCITGIDEFVLGDLRRLPFMSSVFDMVVSWMVVEHLERPLDCFREFSRISRDGGIVVLATPNVFHYAVLVTKLTPYWFHEWARKKVLKSPEETHPTVYRANNPEKLVKMMRDAGFECVEIRLIDSGPAYLSWLAPAYLLGLLYHRLVNRFGWLSFFRFTIIGVFRKVSLSSSL